RGRQVAVDDVDLSWLDSSVLDRVSDAALDTLGARRTHRASAALAATIDGSSQDLRIDVRAPLQSLCEWLEHENSHARPRNQARSRGAKRSAGALGSIVESASQKSQCLEHRPTVDRLALRATHEDSARPLRPKVSISGYDRLGPARARRADRGNVAAGAE